MGIDMGFQAGYLRAVALLLRPCAPEFRGILVGQTFSRRAGLCLAGFVEIYQVCHALRVAQSRRGVYLNRMKSVEYLKGHWQLIAIVVAVFALWSTPVIVPLKILVVFLHEASHRCPCRSFRAGM